MNDFIDKEMNKYEKTITVYTLPFGFKVEVDRNEETSEFYISHKDYGDKMHMFGLANCDTTEQDSIVRSNAIEYMALFLKQYRAE